MCWKEAALLDQARPGQVLPLVALQVATHAEDSVPTTDRMALAALCRMAAHTQQPRLARMRNRTLREGEVQERSAVAPQGQQLHPRGNRGSDPRSLR